MSKYAVVYWKNLNKDKITIREFDDESEMVEFAEEKKVAGNGVIVSEKNFMTMGGEKVYTLRHYGAYYIFRYMAIYFGIILITLTFFIFLLLRGKGI